MSTYRTGSIAEGDQVGFSNDTSHIVASDRGKTHHVFYNKYQQEIERAKELLRNGFEGKPLGEDIVIFLTRTEVRLTVANKIACFE